MNNSMESLLKIIEKDIGYKESPAGSNNTKFGESAGMNYQPWCVSALYYWFKEAGLSDIFYDGKKVASCTLVYNWAKKNGLLVESPQRGDLVIFDWKHDGKPDHIGIIERINGSTLYTIEGNTSVGNDSNGGEVMRRERSTVYKYAYIRPKYPNNVANATIKYINAYLQEVTKGNKSKYVSILQIMLNDLGYDCGKADGIFGDKTDIVLKKYQKDNGLVSDGICGNKTWSKLFSK